VPSPFPGTDPYWEKPGWWRDFHHSFITAVFDRCYSSGGYEDFVDYRAEPIVSLAPEDTKWADALLREAGRRTTM
jgi:hypothetical protein